MGKWTRRAFIGAGTLVGGGFVLGVAGVAFAPGRHTIVSDDAEEKGELTTWITVTPDNLTTILIPHCEMGQGSQTALAMMAAEEMEANWDLVRIQEAPALDAYANAYLLRAFTGDSLPAPLGRAIDYGAYRLARWFGTQVTGGSTAIRGTGYGMTVAGAAAKEMLIAAAAERFGVPAAECTATRSRVTNATSGQAASFGELARAAAAIPVPTYPALKDPDTYTLRRTAVSRFDIPPKVDGSARYGIDVTLPGMLYAAVDIAPVQGGRLVSVDENPALAMPGVERVVQLDEAVAVVADSYWRARQALAALEPVFDDAGHGDVSSDSIFAAFDESLGTAPAMPDGAAQVVTADYRVPFLAHATMEPMACTARVEADRAEVWAGTQDPLNARSTAASALGFDTDQVQLTNLQLGGGYGRRLPFTFDYVDLGVRIAKAVSPTPVKMVWSRENDMQHDFYRPAAMARFAGALDATGRPVAVASHYAGGGDGESLFMPYAIDDIRFEDRDVPHPVRVGEWRSVHNSQHGFFKESFIDELAHAAGKDPYRFRHELLGEQPRFRAVLERVAAMADWERPLPAGEGRGIAIAESFGSIVAQVAHVAITPEGRLRVRNMFAAVDCGDVVNTDTATAQVEGGVIFGLSAAMVAEITIAGGRVVESNFQDHQMIRLADAPAVSVEFIRSGERLGGLGEPGVTPVAPALTNAIYAASGVRVRTLPIKNQELRRA
ncbi:MAG: xanthine dehydrogenase family protein molybdopterin-binding subunit [Acidobacteria bacterium]|nr:xanthine dehydrogenase family protein molybdopterin-binding subunit [Acidobacteriota bacterium]